MKLLELFAKLEEGSLFHRGTGTVSGIYPSSRGNTPNVVFMARDGKNLKQSEYVTAIKVQPRKLKQLYDALLTKKYTTRDITAEEEALLPHINALRSLDITPQSLGVMQALPVKVMDLRGRARIFKYVTTDLRQPMGVYQAVFGDPPAEMEESEFMPFHNARLFVPDTMASRSRAAAIATLEQVYKHLEQAGETDVFRGDIRFVRLNPGVGGIYDINHHDIKVSPNIRKSSQTVYSLLHEYGHKRHLEDMNDAQREIIKDKYRELKMEGEGYVEDIDYASAMLDAFGKFAPGTEIHYIGRKRDYKRDPHYVIKDVFEKGGNYYAKLANASNPKVTLVAYPLMNFLNPKKWRMDGVDLTRPERKEKHEIRSEEWFPTLYSEKSTNPNQEEEWWAELYALYTMGGLGGEPGQWVKEMLSGRATETVGSNAGEVNSDDDVPRPPPAHGDEEGNAQWDWTDPYHSSGEENAVNSRTP